MQGFGIITPGPPKGNDRCFAIELRRSSRCLLLGDPFPDACILEGTGLRWWMCELPVKRLSPFNHSFAPHVFLHAIRRWNPWPPGFTPARGTCNRHLHSILICKCSCVLESVLPLR